MRKRLPPRPYNSNESDNMAKKKSNPTDREAGLVPESEYIAQTTSNVPRPESEERARASFASGMRFNTLCSRYGLRPDAALRVLGISKEQVDKSEWYWAHLHYSNSNQITRNAVRGDRGEPAADNRMRDVCDNPMRSPRR